MLDYVFEFVFVDQLLDKFFFGPLRFSCFDSTLEKCHSRKRQIFLIFFEPLSLKRRLLGRFNAMFPFIQSRLCSFSFFLWLVGRKQLRTRTGEGVKERGGVGLKKIRNSTSASPPHTHRTHHPHSRVPFSFAILSCPATDH